MKNPNCIYEASGLMTFEQKRLRLYAILVVVGVLVVVKT